MRGIEQTYNVISQIRHLATAQLNMEAGLASSERIKEYTDSGIVGRTLPKDPVDVRYR